MPRGPRKKITKAEYELIPKDSGRPGFCGESFASYQHEDAAKILRASIEHPNRLQGFGGAYLYPGWERYEQIEKGIMPFNMSQYSGGVIIDIQQMVELCQKTYFNVAIFRNTIDIMTEFSNSEVLFKGGNEKSRKFFENWYYNKIGGYNLADQFFREWYRSGNVFLYRFDADVDLETLRKIGSMYGADEIPKAGKKLPIKYLLINPAYLRVDYGLNFLSSNYYKLLTNYEMARLKNPITDEEKEFYKALPKEAKEAIQNGSTALLPLDPSLTYMIFCKRQDYEPFSVPMFFGVLEDIDLKLIYKRMEKIISRTVELVQLKIAVGDSNDPNPLAIDALKELYQNETIGRVLIAPGPLEMDFVIPDLNKILGSEKYQQVNDDISQGLMGIFSQDEKYSGASIKVKIFMERLSEARQSYLSNFLNPEIKRISKELGFKNYPIATMAGLDLNDQIQTNKIYLQLLQLGAITPDEAIQAVKTGYLPTPDEGLESQKEFKSHRDSGYYLPLMSGGAFGQETGENGRPLGSKAPQSSKNPKPAGTSKGEYEGFDLNKLSEVFVLTSNLGNALEQHAKKHFKAKKLTENQKEILKSLVPLIVSNEKIEDWEIKAKEYINSPIPIKDEIGYELDEISSTFDCSLLLASILRHCKS